MRILVPLAVVAVLAGCGSATRAVSIEKTPVVQAKPCATAAAMSACAVDLARAIAKRNGLPVNQVHGRCSQAGAAAWRCTMQLPLSVSRVACADAVVEKTVSGGAPSIAGLSIVPFARCAAALGAL